MADSVSLQRPILSILDVGHSNCAVLQDVDGVVVVDAGPGTTLREFLQQEGIERIDALLISHADTDHVAGVIAVLNCEEIAVKLVRLNSDALKKSALWDDLLYLLDQRHKAGDVDFEVALTTRDTGAYDQGSVRIEILAPSLYLAGRSPGSTDRKGRRITSNTVSAVIRLTMDGVPVALLPGDLDQTGLDNLLEDAQDLEAPLAVFPHHGGMPGTRDSRSFAKSFCEEARSTTIIFSIGRGQHDTPRPDIVETVRQTLPEVWILCTQLSKHCATSVSGSAPSHLTDAFAGGRQDRKCCAGTIIVQLSSEEIAFSPNRCAHRAYVQEVAPTTSLCLR